MANTKLMYYLKDGEWLSPGRIPLQPGYGEPPTAGAAPLGQTDYAIPSSNVIFVATNGNDSNPGTLSQPKRTILAASNAVRSLGTPSQPAVVVIRGGVYREGSYEPGNGYYLRWQAYPGEIVWYDGSVAVTTPWIQSGSAWMTDYAAPPLVPLGTDVLAGDPNAALPDMFWLDNVRLQQIADNAVPGAGQYSVNRSTNKVTIGSDPSGKVVHYSAHARAIYSGSRIDLLGIGIRRYRCAISGENIGIFYGGNSQNVIIEHCFIEDMGRNAIAYSKDGSKLRYCTIRDIWQNGFRSTTSDNLIVENNLFERTNRGRWRTQPQSGAIKITRSRDIIIRNNIIKDAERGNLIWMDVAVIKPLVYNNYLDGSSSFSGIWADSGICYEESDGGYPPNLSLIVGNTVLNCHKSVVVCAGGRVIVGWNTISSKWSTTSGPQAILVLQDRDIAVDGQEAPIDEYLRWTIGVRLWSNHILPQEAGWQLLAYDSQGEISSTGRPRALAKFGQNQLAGGEMLQSVVGNNFAPATGVSSAGSIMATIGERNGNRTNRNTPSELAALNGSPVYLVPGGTIGVNTQGLEPVHSAAYPMPSDIAGILGLTTGLKYQGNPLPDPVAI